MKTETLAALQEARANRRAVTLATRLSDAAEALVYRDGAKGELAGEGALVAAAQRAMDIGKSETVEIADDKIFLNVYVPPPRLIIVGAVHIAQSLAPMAAMLEFDVTVVDPRGAWATTQRFPGVKVIQDWADEAFQAMGLDGSTAVVTLTHDPKLDDPALESALKSDVFYIGALGSRRTHAKRKERLAEVGITEEMFARVHGPVGLNIGAKSPAEIAVSILGQIIEVRARRLEALSAPKVAAA
ncbi:XdhC family protein [Reyranella sp. MMS21-HV4-11]|uniref:XdhC family protein n=1 Tax=Reyranella humidisoli TaxID=2849149 RepID=A0ABS6ISM4_9HYPH|nr:XdhC family protein [Reyranella sp. MMS21-HV4-11]MBU8877024.1 XdhC family protein [Reyranella sp. MMS21-HV4-11]